MTVGPLLLRLLLLTLLATAAGLADAALRPLPPRPPSGELGTPRTRETDLSLETARGHFDAGTAFFVDARSPQQRRNGGRIPGAVALEPGDLAGGAWPPVLDGWSRSHDLLIVFCSDPNACESSDLVAVFLKEFGFERVHTLEGGFAAWKRAGHPTEAAR